MTDCRLDSTQPESKVIAWRSWSVVNGEIVRRSGRTIHEWLSVPKEGFQFWVLYYNRRLPDPLGVDRKIIHDFDYYYMAPGIKDWIYYGTSKVQDLAAYPGAVVKYGRSVDEVTFVELKDEVESAAEP